MEIWLSIFLAMSLTLNILQFKAYSEREEECREILNMREELEKAKESLNRTLAKHGKAEKRKGFLAGYFGKKKGSKS